MSYQRGCYQARLSAAVSCNWQRMKNACPIGQAQVFVLGPLSLVEQHQPDADRQRRSAERE
jgi:hypothetical protein